MCMRSASPRTEVLFWSTDGQNISAMTDWNEINPQIVSDGAGGAIISWYADRPGYIGTYAQRVSSYGTWQWGWEGGIPLFIAPMMSIFEFRLVPDGEGGAIAAWQDYRSGTVDLYVQRIDTDGNILWNLNGTGICTGVGGFQEIEAAPDEGGGIVVVWADYTSGSHSYSYVQRVNAGGWWGNPEPAILSCLDVPADEGGFVRVQLRASSHDVKFELDYPVEGYNAWRKIGGGGAGALAEVEDRSIDRVKARSLMAECLKTPLARISSTQALALGFPEGEWESIGYHAATRDTVYNFLVPTRSDSTESGTAMETYLVTAHAPAAGVFVVSDADSGYSVDNLAPGGTSGFAGNETASPPGLQLAWTANPASDLWKYNVYRGADELFVPDESNLLGSTTDTELHDGSWVKAYLYFYKLLAVDRHGNMGLEALLRPEDIKVGTMLQSFAASLEQSAIVDVVDGVGDR